MTGDGDGGLPVADSGADTIHQDGGAEHGAVQGGTDGAVGALPHLVEIVLGHTLGVGSDGGALDAHAIFFDGLGAVMGDLVAGFVPLGQTQIIIVHLQIHKGQNQLFLDGFPKDSRHFVAVDLHQRRGHSDAFHAFFTPFIGVLVDNALTAVDGGTQAVEAFLIAGHNAHNAVPMQIIGDVADFQVAAAELVERKVKQGPVVGLEMNLAAVTEHRGILVQEGAIRQPQLGCLVPGPGVAEIEIDQVHFAFGKEVRQHRGVGVNEKNVGEVFPHGVFHGHDHGVGDLFQGDEQHIGLGLGRLHGEFSLAAADFQTDFFCGGHQVLPVALEGGGIADPNAVTSLHPGA